MTKLAKLKPPSFNFQLPFQLLLLDVSCVQRRVSTRRNIVAKFVNVVVQKYTHTVEHAMSFHLQRCSLVLFPCALFDVHGGIPEQPLVAA